MREIIGATSDEGDFQGSEVGFPGYCKASIESHWPHLRRRRDRSVDDDYSEDAPEAPQEKAEESLDPLAEYHEHLAMQRQAAAIVTYACDADVDGKRPTPSPCLSKLQVSWLGGLGAGDLRAIADSEREAVFNHIGSGPYIQGLMRTGVAAGRPAPLTRNDISARMLTWNAESEPTVSLD
jgi:hypothetical protein